MKPIVVTSGEPAGIGPDICLELNQSRVPAVVLADRDMLSERKRLLGYKASFVTYQGETAEQMDPGQLYVIHSPARVSVKPGVLDVNNSRYVIQLIEEATSYCLKKDMSAMVTAPVHKAVINDAGIPFTGHTEYLAHLSQVNTVVMMLACSKMRVALVTTHLPLAQVPKAISKPLLTEVIDIIDESMRHLFKLKTPTLAVAGLNPHAGENGYLGREDLDIIKPVIDYMNSQGHQIKGPVPADTLFCSPEYSDVDVYVAMYHDQGLPVVKYAGFHQTANVTLGLPFIRTSVDHGTALGLSGKGKAKSDSLCYAAKYAWDLVQLQQDGH